jgi:putative drug exporter of the RND superfamily
MSTLTLLVLRHRLVVLLVWVAVAAAGIATMSSTVARMSNSSAMPGAAYQIDKQITAEYRNGGNEAPYVAVLTAPAGQRITDPVPREQSGEAFAAIAADVPGLRVADYASTGDPAFVTRDGRTTFALVFPPSTSGFGDPGAGPALQRALIARTPPGWTAGVTGSALLAAGSASSSKGTGMAAEATIGAVGALVVLAVVFGSFLAVLPLVIGGVSVVVTFLVVGGLTRVTEVSQVVEFLIALIGLGVAIDFSLLIVSRWREERSAGRDNRAAVVAAMDHAGRAVAFSGVTVAIGLLSLVILPVPMLRSVGFSGVLVPLVSVAASLTLLPVVLSAAGPALDRLRLRTDRTASPFWSAWARVVYRHRWISALAGFAIIGLLMVPAASMHLGEPAGSTLATSGPAHDTLALLARGGVPSGVLTPVEVLVRADGAQVARAATAVPGVYAAVAPATPDYQRPGTSQRPGTAIVTVIPAVESNLSAGQTTVERIRTALAADPAVVGVGGVGASTIDFENAVYGRFPLMLALIGIATLLLLTRAFRSVLLAAKAVAFNLISLTAAYGVLTWVWQDGHGSQAIWGVPATGAITMWVPLMVFAFLFGLSMDYEVFILARVRESYDATGDAEAAVVEGIGRTGRLVTSAAAILLLSFVSMSTGPTTDLRILATGLGAGIAVDAVVVRCLLVPAMVALFGRANWWLPPTAARWLRISAPVPSPRPAPRSVPRPAPVVPDLADHALSR